MELGELNTRVQEEIPQISRIIEVKLAANKAIQVINRKFPGLRTIEKVLTMKVTKTEALTFADADPDTITTTTDISSYIAAGDYAAIEDSDSNDGAYKIASVSTTTITLDSAESLTAESTTICKITIYRPSNSYTLSDSRVVAFPDTVKRMIKAWENDIELVSRSYEFVKDTYNSAELVFAENGRYGFMFPTGMLDTAEDVLKIEADKRIEEFSTATSSASITIPAQLTELLFQGTMFNLLAFPQYRNDTYDFYREMFETGVRELAEWEYLRVPAAKNQPDFVYGKES